MSEYLLILIDRFPPSSDFYKLSAGFNKMSGAIAATKGVSVIFTSDDLQPIIESQLYVDSKKQTIFAGNDLWYHVFGSTGTDLAYVIQVGANGVVANKTDI